MATLTNAGMGRVSGLVNGEVTNFFEHLALGTNDTSESASDTALGSEINSNGGERAEATTSQVTTSVTDDTAKWVKTFNFTGSLSINECGVLDAGTGGNLLMRHVFSSTKNVENGDSLELTVKMQIS